MAPSSMLYAEDKGISVDELRELAKEADQEADKTPPEQALPEKQSSPSTGSVLGPAVEKILDAPVTVSTEPKSTTPENATSDVAAPTSGKTVVAPANSGPQPPGESTTAVGTKTVDPKSTAAPKLATPESDVQAPQAPETGKQNKSTTATKSTKPSSTDSLGKQEVGTATNAASVGASSNSELPVEADEEDEIYIAPRRITGVSQSDANDDTPISKNFGIPSGTWLRVELVDEVSSAGTNRATLKLLHTVSGDFDVLPKGTLLYAYSQVNQQSHRIDLTVTEGITPSGLRFSGRATAYDKKRRVGLAGAVVKMNMPTSLDNSTQAVLEPERATIARNTQGSTQSDVGATLTQPSDDLIILVPPQAALLRVDTAF